jgi:hypothetical protein
MLTPSAAARGDPLVTDDGWTVRVEALVMLGYLSVACSREYEKHDSEGTFVIDVARPFQFFQRAVVAGTCPVNLAFFHLLLDPSTRKASIPLAPFVRPGDTTAPALLRRFEETADDYEPESGFAGAFTESGERMTDGPALLIRLRGEREGRVVVVDLALAIFSFSERPFFEKASTKPLDVVPNELRFVEFVVAPERVLVPGGAVKGRTFGDIAAADADGDGQATPDELRAVRVRLHADGSDVVDPTCVLPRTRPEEGCGTLLHALRRRASGIMLGP